MNSECTNRFTAMKKSATLQRSHLALFLTFFWLREVPRQLLKAFTALWDPNNRQVGNRTKHWLEERSYIGAYLRWKTAKILSRMQLKHILRETINCDHTNRTHFFQAEAKMILYQKSLIGLIVTKAVVLSLLISERYSGPNQVLINERYSYLNLYE